MLILLVTFGVPIHIIVIEVEQFFIVLPLLNPAAK